jgi:hypothetical protein
MKNHMVGSLQALRDSVVEHELRARQAADALRNADLDKQKANQDLSQNISITSRFKEWWHSDTASRPTVTAISSGQGEAVVGLDDNNREIVKSSGSAQVTLNQTDTSVRGGRQNADVTAQVGPGEQAHSSIKMAESARDVGSNIGARAPLK